MRHLSKHYYHVFNRGCDRRNIFANDGNYRFLLLRFSQFLVKYPIKVIAYCFMPNHYHLLLCPEEDEVISGFIQRLFNSYAQAFNRQQRRKGTLFEGRAKSVLVDTNEYILQLCRYIHLNPVKARLVTHPGGWPYSNYLEWIEGRSGMLWDRSFSRTWFPNPGDYESFVMSEIDPEISKKMQRFYFD